MADAYDNFNTYEKMTPEDATTMARTLLTAQQLGLYNPGNEKKYEAHIQRALYDANTDPNAWNDPQRFNGQNREDWADGDLGEKSYQVIMDFLQTGDNCVIAHDLNEGIKRHLAQSKVHDTAFKQVLEDAVNYTGSIEDLISRFPLSEIGTERLQTLLTEQGFDTKGIDGDWGRNTRNALIDYIGENPDSLAKATIPLLQDFINAGKGAIIRDIAGRSPAFQQRIEASTYRGDGGGYINPPEERAILEKVTGMRISAVKLGVPDGYMPNSENTPDLPEHFKVAAGKSPEYEFTPGGPSPVVVV